MLCEKDTTIFQVSENSSLAEMRVDLMITVIRAEIKFMNSLLEESGNIDFNIINHEFGVLNGLMSVISNNTEEINIFLLTHNKTNQKIDEKLIVNKDN